METYGMIDPAGLAQRPFTDLRLVFDTAALVLIWLVQLVIYPVFLQLKREEFRVWHPIYTRRVTLIVMPIMLGQLGLYLLSCFTAPTDWSVLCNTLLVVLAWVITFFGAVPLHAKLDGPVDHVPLSRRLLRVNAYRTGLWSIVWVVTVVARFPPHF